MCFDLDASSAIDIACAFSQSKERIITVGNYSISPADLMTISQECQQSNNLTRALQSAGINVNIPTIPSDDELINRYNDTLSTYSWLKPILSNPNDTLNTLQTINPSFQLVGVLQGLLSDQQVMSISAKLSNLDTQSLTNSVILAEINHLRSSMNQIFECRKIANDYQLMVKSTCKDTQKSLDSVYFYLFLIILLGLFVPILSILLVNLPESDSLKYETSFPYRSMPVFGPFS